MKKYFQLFLFRITACFLKPPSLLICKPLIICSGAYFKCDASRGVLTIKAEMSKSIAKSQRQIIFWSGRPMIEPLSDSSTTVNAFILARFQAHLGKSRCVGSVLKGMMFCAPKLPDVAPRVPCPEVWFDFKVGRSHEDYRTRTDEWREATNLKFGSTGSNFK